MSLKRFLDRADESRRSLLVANRSSPDPILNVLEATFDDQPVRVSERAVPDVETDTVLLVEDGEVLATSPLSALRDTIVTVNSDLYRTGAMGIDDLDMPAVLERLDDVRFTLRGYPKSNTEKLLLVVVSRYIEGIAWQAGHGRHRASFQYLSRIKDERGTRRVYERLAETDVDVHVYGRPDWVPSERFDVTTHVGHDADFRDSWVVLFRPRPPTPDANAPDSPSTDHDPVALLAIETEPHVWEGFWTFDQSLVADLDAYVAREL
ncbi:histidine kinase [Haloplanus salilacus]|uniref:histidine kinase n=1 Tax=Haloplanus salilacus TaxID=2949994 RepID=UPI0030CEDE90